MTIHSSVGGTASTTTVGETHPPASRTHLTGELAAGFGATLRRDPYAWFFLAVVLILEVPYYVPILSQDQLWHFALEYYSIIILPALMVVFQGRLRTIARRRERRFWHAMTLALLFWWAVSCSYVLVPDRWWGPTADLLTDCVFVLFYLSILGAIEMAPHRRSPTVPDLMRSLRAIGGVVLVFGLMVYLVLIPARLDPAAYDTWLPSLLLYVALDVLLAVRFARLHRLARGPRWRTLYGLLTLTAVGFGVTDLLEFHSYAGLLGIPDVSRWNVLWQLPLVVAALAARLRHHRFAGDPEPAVADEPEQPLGSPLVFSAFFFPLLHFGLGSFGLLDPATTAAREVVVFLVLFILGAMAVTEHAALRRKSALLEKESEEHTTYLHHLIASSPLAIVVLDPEHRVRMCNPAFEALFLFPRSEVVGTTLDDLIATEETSDEARELTRRVVEGETVHEVTRRRRRDGSEVDVEVHGVPLHVGGRLIGIYGLYQDITDRRLAEQAQRDSEERFRRLADATFEGIVVLDEGRIIDANEQYARMLGRPLAELIGRQVLDLVVPEDRSLVAEKIRCGDEQAYEHRVRRPDGSTFIVEVHGRTHPYRGRTVRVSAVRDVTERKRFEEGIRQTQKMEAIGRLAGGIAHDFNNLLTVISGYGELLAEEIEDAPLRRQVEHIRRAATRASLLTRRLLAFARHEPLATAVLDLNQQVAGMEEILRRLIREDIDLRLRTAAAPAWIEADFGQIEQVILNLAINAADAMPQGGVLTLETAPVELAERVPDAVPPVAAGSYVALTVRDTGSGMDAETVGRVFEPFFTTKIEGTGLGLATVYGIVQQSGGGIAVRSAPGQGAVFRVFFPRAAATPKRPRAEPGAVRRPPAGGETVLVVEDEAEVRTLTVEMLKLRGFHVLAAADGRQALAEAEGYDGTIDLVLTDVVMPGLSGPEMAAKVLALRPQARVLYMSGYADEVLGRQGSPAGTHLLYKPFSEEELIGKVREVLAEADPAASN